MSTAVPVGADPIRLGQFLQVAGLAETGSDAKALLVEGEVWVNGEAEVRRGRQLHIGDIVCVGEQELKVVAEKA